MLKTRFAAAAAAMLFTSAIVAPASAQTIVTFDDLADGPAVPAGYAGLNWANFVAFNGDNLGGGYANAAVSGTQIAYNSFANPATISGASPFTFNSGYFTSAWNNGMTVNVTGFVGGVQTFADSFLVDSTGPTFRTFDWANLSSVSFVGVGGVNQGYGGIGTHIAFDDLAFNAAVGGGVPEPTTWALMILGMGAVGGAMRRRTVVKARVRLA